MGHSLPCPYYSKGFPGGSMAGFCPKTAPKHDTKNHCPPIPAVLAETGGFFVRRHYAEDVKEAETGTCFLSE